MKLHVYALMFPSYSDSSTQKLPGAQAVGSIEQVYFAIR